LIELDGTDMRRHPLANGASSGGVKIRGSRSRAEVKDGESVACGPAQPGNNFSRRAPRSVVTGNYLQNNLSSRGATLLPAPSSPLPNRCPRGRLRAPASLVSTLGIDCPALMGLIRWVSRGDALCRASPAGTDSENGISGSMDQAIAATNSNQARAFRAAQRLHYELS
jgi:hypothetical protein